jgi:cation:H+ antiporter
MNIVTLILLIVGLGFLVGGAELLVRGASRLATAVGISPLAVGLTVVAFGTSAPELAVSMQSGLAGQADIALGNVVGSNIFNTLFILGLSAAIVPLVVSQQLVRLEVPLLIGVSGLLYVLAFDGRIGQVDGVVLFSGILMYTVFAIRQSRKESKQIQVEYEQEFGTETPKTSGQLVMQVGLIVVGLILLVVGSRWLVDGAVAIAEVFGVSQVVIGLTVVAAGTSLPELATSVIAAIRGERDIAVGNVIGSNLFNILSILGLASIVTPGGLVVAPSMLSFDMPIMMAVAVACLPVFFIGYTIYRWEGVLFLLYYAAYTTYLVLSATEHDTLPLYSNIMLLFVVPLTLVTFVALSIRALRATSRTRVDDGRI